MIDSETEAFGTSRLGSPISAFNNSQATVEIHDEGRGVFHMLITGTNGGLKTNAAWEQTQLAEALSWWRNETKETILSIAGLPGDEECSAGLIIVTENQDPSLV